MNYYVDSCVWIDFLENRKSGLIPIGEFAFVFFKKCKQTKSKIYFSNLVFKEISKYLSKEKINFFLNDFSEIIVFVEYSKEQISLAKKLSNELESIHFSDALHAVIAKENDCVLITRDNHFDELSFFVEVCLPEEVLG